MSRMTESDGCSVLASEAILTTLMMHCMVYMRIRGQVMTAAEYSMRNLAPAHAYLDAICSLLVACIPYTHVRSC